MNLRSLVGFLIIINMVFFSPLNILHASALSVSGMPDIQATSAILIEPSRGQILYKKEIDEKLHISNTCKIMTAIIAIEKIKPETVIAISKDATNIEGDRLNLEAGEKYSAEDLVYAIILTSANDAAHALAEYAGGDVTKFVALMNSKAKELKMENTNFRNPTGLTDEEQYTTASDTSLLMGYALKNPVFQKIFSTSGKPFNSKILINRNKLFWSYSGVDGGKAGYNDKEKQSVITTATRNGQRLLAIVLDTPESNMWTDSEKILDFGFNNHMTGLLVSSGQKLNKITVEGKEVNLVCTTDVYYTHPIGEDNIESLEFKIGRDIKLPILKEHSIGTAKYTLKDKTVINVPLYPDENIELPKSLWDKIVQTLSDKKDLLYLLYFLIGLEFILIIRNITKLAKKIFKKPTNS